MGVVERIKEKCIENNTNIAQIEKELEIGNGVIRRWNERSPGAYQLYKIAVRLNTNIEWLLLGKENNQLSDDEMELLENYRKSSTQGKGSILAQAQYQAKQSGVSTSRNGLTGTDN